MGSFFSKSKPDEKKSPFRDWKCTNPNICMYCKKNLDKDETTLTTMGGTMCESCHWEYFD